MTQLKKFSFCINTTVFRKVTAELPSNEDIQRSFIGRGYQQVSSYVHTDLMMTEGECLIYSLPYEFDYFFGLNNSFSSGIFHKVRYLKMSDTIPFEHQFFKLISQDFPFLEFLYISNKHSQKDKQYSSTLITFLDLKWAHVDYVELFLLEKNMHLSRWLNLSIQYKNHSQ
jgi:hypothetical protein